MIALTETQASVLAYVQECVVLGNGTPSQREISMHMGWKSPSAATCVIRILERKGFLSRVPGVTRNIRVTEAGRKAILLLDLHSKPQNTVTTEEQIKVDRAKAADLALQERRKKFYPDFDFPNKDSTSK